MASQHPAGVAPGRGPVTPRPAGRPASAGRSEACSGWARDRGGLRGRRGCQHSQREAATFCPKCVLTQGRSRRTVSGRSTGEKLISGKRTPRLAGGGAAPKRVPILLPPAQAASAHAPSFLRTHRGVWTGLGAQVSLRRVGRVGD